MKDMVFQEKAKLWVLKTDEWQSKSRWERRGLKNSAQSLEESPQNMRARGESLSEF